MKTKILYLEIIVAAIALVGVIFINKPMLPSVLYMVVLLTYAVVCMLISQAYPKPQNPKENIKKLIHNLSWMALSVVSVGIFFYTQHFPGGRMMLFLGLASSVIPFIYHLINIGKDKDEKQDDQQNLNNKSEEVNQPTTIPFIQKWLGDVKYNHSEMLIRLGIALLIVIKLMYFTQGLYPEVLQQEMGN